MTLDIGGNDFLDLLNPGGPSGDPSSVGCQQAVGLALQQMAGNFGVIVSQTAGALAADPGDERFVVMTYYNPFGGTGHPMEPVTDSVLLGIDGVVDCSASGTPGAWGANDILACLAWRAGAEVVDLYVPFGDDASTLTHINEGDIQPSAAGHRLIADLLSENQ